MTQGRTLTSAWIETYFLVLFSCLAYRRTLTSAWIETTIGEISASISERRTLTSAWIETIEDKKLIRSTLVALSRVRGLKRTMYNNAK